MFAHATCSSQWTLAVSLSRMILLLPLAVQGGTLHQVICQNPSTKVIVSTLSGSLDFGSETVTLGSNTGSLVSVAGLAGGWFRQYKGDSNPEFEGRTIAGTEQRGTHTDDGNESTLDWGGWFGTTSWFLIQSTSATTVQIFVDRGYSSGDPISGTLTSASGYVWNDGGTTDEGLLNAITTFTTDDGVGNTNTIQIVTCQNAFDAGSGECTLSGVQQACPSLGVSTGSVMGDPHISRWRQGSFEFHGECDLVMLHSNTVNGTKRLDLHVRTTIDGAFSSITGMALQVGNDLVEIDPDFVYYQNQQIKWKDLPLHTDNFYVTRPKRRFQSRTQRRQFNIVLNEKSVIRVLRTKLDGSLNFLSISVEGSYEDFAESHGLLGEFLAGNALGRDGRDMTGDWNAYGMEWQVQPHEPKLFRDKNRAPQLPHAQCNMPSVFVDDDIKSLGKRNPHLYIQAQTACAKAGKSLNDCMEDVMLAKDIQAAEAYTTMDLGESAIK